MEKNKSVWVRTKEGKLFVKVCTGDGAGRQVDFPTNLILKS